MHRCSSKDFELLTENCFNRLMVLLTLRMAKIEAGDIVVDPMCGGGSIPIEGSLTYKTAMHLGGDSHIKAVERLAIVDLNQRTDYSLLHIKVISHPGVQATF